MDLKSETATNYEWVCVPRSWKVQLISMLHYTRWISKIRSLPVIINTYLKKMKTPAKLRKKAWKLWDQFAVDFAACPCPILMRKISLKSIPLVQMIIAVTTCPDHRNTESISGSIYGPLQGWILSSKPIESVSNILMIPKQRIIPGQRYLICVRNMIGRDRLSGPHWKPRRTKNSSYVSYSESDADFHIIFWKASLVFRRSFLYLAGRQVMYPDLVVWLFESVLLVL